MFSSTKNILDTINTFNNTDNNSTDAPLPEKNQIKQVEAVQKKDKSIVKNTLTNIQLKAVRNPLWISVSEAAKIGGVTSKTIRRAIQSRIISYKIVKNRYFLDLSSVIDYLHTKTKLKNKLEQRGIGQYIRNWRE